MPLREEFERSGNWLFRWRSYLPLALAGIILPGLWKYDYPGQSHPLEQLWELFCLSVAFLGLAIRIYTVGHSPKGTSGRSTRRYWAETLNTSGLYSIVRHPLYLGNFFVWLGISMYPCDVWVSLTFVLIFWLYHERIMFSEEEFLRHKFGDAYMEWASRTPAFLPKFKAFRRPSTSFSLRKVLRKEYSGLFAIIASFTFLEVIRDMVVQGKPEIDRLWAIIFSIGLVTFVVIRALKKATTILDDKL